MGLDCVDSGIIGSRPTQGMDVCPCLCVVLSSVGRGLATSWPPVQGILPSVRKWGLETSRTGSLHSPRSVQPRGERDNSILTANSHSLLQFVEHTTLQLKWYTAYTVHSGKIQTLRNNYVPVAVNHPFPLLPFTIPSFQPPQQSSWLFGMGNDEVWFELVSVCDNVWVIICGTNKKKHSWIIYKLDDLQSDNQEWGLRFLWQ
jgi:hypothetical protein